ncbi:protein of unknown function [Micropruina glycogenica]|uniref:Uncharacterized protein n=1 Tax=Micropruina glycogenica TaxID=75385 RepID=A0A2N9JKZ4_9ACTN|nr:protein of unknown function [Micropruina glycogenica]
MVEMAPRCGPLWQPRHLVVEIDTPGEYLFQPQVGGTDPAAFQGAGTSCLTSRCPRVIGACLI